MRSGHGSVGASLCHCAESNDLRNKPALPGIRGIASNYNSLGLARHTEYRQPREQKNSWNVLY